MKTMISKALLCAILIPSTATFANEAFDRDAQEYAILHGVGIDEAKKALNIELHRDDIISLIENQYKGRLAGIYIENTPTYTIVVKLKGSGRNEKKEIALDKTLPNINVPVEFIYGAKTTINVAKGQLQKAQNLAQQYLTGVQMVSYNEKTGQIDIEINAQNTDKMQSKINQLQKAWKNPHLDLNIIFVGYSVKPMAIAYGGTPVVDKSQVAATGVAYDCTTGFDIKNNQGNQE
ncbi:hypothetical protein ACFBZI_03905 [Moraxella sp. ZJ142]|uniref:hypothetical protein n=1 Tax=Moraxella marmotae TaxID=3344520 RepID=UPI0035D4E5D3